jgi:hypothetical protein
MAECGGETDFEIGKSNETESTHRSYLRRYPPHMASTSKARKPRQSRAVQADPFRNLAPGGQKSSISLRSLASSVYIDHLVLTEQQKSQIEGLYANSQISDSVFKTNDGDQIQAGAELATHGLDVEAREWIDSRWSMRWSMTQGKGAKETSRALYQWYEQSLHTENK